MMDKKELSFLPLLALLLSAAVLGFSTCGTPEVGFVPDGDADGPSTILASGTDGIGHDLTRASVAPTATDTWSTYTNSTYGFSLQHPPEFDVPAGNLGDPRGFIGDKIVFSVGESNPYWVGCLSEALGDCPVMEAVEKTHVAGRGATRISGYIGAVGGNIPQQYITYVVSKDEVYHVFTLYALSRASAEQAGGTIWPLSEEDIAVFERIMGTLRFFEVVDGPSSPVFCRPEKASMTLHATATTLRVGQTVTVSIALVNGETSNVRLGQPQYMLYAHPDVFSLGGMEPVERPVTLEPGQSDDIEFVLQATAPGRTMLMGTVGYEMHDLEYSWASWSGCNAEPLEITITP
jgi:hypothetical protein